MDKMTFRQALSTVLQTDKREFTADAFYLYSRICDICKSSYEDTQKNKLFFELNKRLHIVENLYTNGKRIIPVLIEAYSEVKNLLTRSSYTKLINCVAEEAGIVDVKQTTPPKITPHSVDKQKNSPIKTYRKFPWKTVGICVGVAVVIAALIACLVVFRSKIQWNGWQHLIGSLGGLVFTAIVSVVILLLDDNLICNFYILGLITLLLVAVVNWLLNLFLGANYRIIFIWLSAYEIIGGIALIIWSIDSAEDVWVWMHIVAVLVIVAGLVLGLVFF